MFGETAATLQLEIENNQYFLEKGRYLIGNDRRSGRSRNYIQVTNLYADVKHCVLEVDSNEEIFIVDLESDSGVYINNKRVDPLTKERLKPDEDFSLGGQLKAKIKLIEREESHNGNRLENISVIKDVTPRPIVKDESVQQLNLENPISNDNHDSVNVPAVQSHQPIPTCSAVRATNIYNSVNQNSPNGDQVVGTFSIPEIQEVKIEYPDYGDYNFVESVPMTTIVSSIGSSQQAERDHTSHATTTFQGCYEYSIQNNNKSTQVAKKSLGNKIATNINKRANQNSPNGHQEVVNFHTAKIPEVKIEYPDFGDYNFVESVPMTSIVSSIGAPQEAERDQTSHATTSFQGCYEYSIQNNNKIKEIAKKGLGNKKAVAEREKESNKSSSNDEIESSHTSEKTAPKTNEKNNMSTRNIAMQGIPRRRLTRCHTLACEPSPFNELPENNEFEKTLNKRLTRSQTRKKEKNNNTEYEMLGRRFTRSHTQDGERTRFIELVANGNKTQKENVTRSNVHKKERKTSLPLPSADVADVVSTQPLAHFIETRVRLRNTNRPSSSNANNAGSSGNVAKRKGGAKFNSKKSKYPKKNK